MTNNVAKIKVLGIGGGGGNAVNYMASSTLNSVEFAVFNTDTQAINSLENIENKFVLGQNTTQGLGAGANPSVGEKATSEDIDLVDNFIDGSNIVFVTAGMGGGTGTGGAPIVSKCSKVKDILTIGVVTKPFSFEGKKRIRIAEEGLEKLKENVDALIVIPNERLLDYLGEHTKLTDAFNEANEVLLKAVRGVSELITRPGLINIDFADMKTVMCNSGYSMMGIGISSGEEKAKIAVESALESPLLDNFDIKGAKGILINVSSSENLSIGEFNVIGNIVESYADNEATIVIGTTIDPELNDSIQVTVVATGLNEKESINIDEIGASSISQNDDKNDQEDVPIVDIENTFSVVTGDEQEYSTEISKEDKSDSKKTSLNKLISVPEFLKNRKIF